MSTAPLSRPAGATPQINVTMQATLPQRNPATSLGGFLGHMKSVAPGLIPWKPVLRMGGLGAVAGIGGMLQGKNPFTDLLAGPSPQQFGTEMAAKVPPAS